MPSMYLKKLGNERRNSKTGRRKSRLFSTNQLRNPTEEEEEEVVEGERANKIAENGNEFFPAFPFVFIILQNEICSSRIFIFGNLRRKRIVWCYPTFKKDLIKTIQTLIQYNNLTNIFMRE